MQHWMTEAVAGVSKPQAKGLPPPTPGLPGAGKLGRGTKEISPEFQREPGPTDNLISDLQLPEL